jgi:hypothetical protein
VRDVLLERFRIAVDECLPHLTEGERAALEPLVNGVCETSEEVATHLGLNCNLVRVRLHRARLTLRGLLAKRDFVFVSHSSETPANAVVLETFANGEVLFYTPTTATEREE